MLTIKHITPGYTSNCQSTEKVIAEAKNKKEAVQKLKDYLAENANAMLEIEGLPDIIRNGYVNIVENVQNWKVEITSSSIVLFNGKGAEMDYYTIK